MPDENEQIVEYTIINVRQRRPAKQPYQFGNCVGVPYDQYGFPLVIL